MNLKNKSIHGYSSFHFFKIISGKLLLSMRCDKWHPITFNEFRQYRVCKKKIVQETISAYGDWVQD